MVKHKKNSNFWGLYAWGAWGAPHLPPKEGERMAAGGGVRGREGAQG